MAPSASKTPPGTQIGAPKMSAADFAMANGSSHSGSSSATGTLATSTMTMTVSSTTSTTKDNQRPPVYNAEDYIQSLKKYSRRAGGGSSGSASGTIKSIYDTSDNNDNGMAANNTLPAITQGKEDNSFGSAKDKRSGSSSKHSDYKSPIPTPPANECEMSLRQFASITDLLTKLRADLRASFPSFVQELVASPMDGVSLLLEVLRAIQLSQGGNATVAPHSATAAQSAAAVATMQRNNQTYQRRALLDELACLQCINLCTTRCPEAALRLGTSPVGLMPLAAAATGQGIRSRILALQLLTAACDRALSMAAHSAGAVATGGGNGSSTTRHHGHNSVSEALSTLRLRCGEPVRFRLLVGMMNSGGGSGELQLHGLKFVNTFLASAESSQERLYVQAELYQAGFDPMNMANTITESSPWLEKLHAEVRYFEEHKIDVEKLLVQNREAERIRSQMVILERRVQILHEEKTVLTSMERRLQERCAELQREVFRLQGAQHQDSYKNLDKRPVALPRLVPPPSSMPSNNADANNNMAGANEEIFSNEKPSNRIASAINKPATATSARHRRGGASELDDEGISSSETGQSMSPEPCLVLPMGNSQKYRITVTSEDNTMRTATATPTSSTNNINHKSPSGSSSDVSRSHKNLHNLNSHNVPDCDDATTIDDVIEELANIVSDAEREIRASKTTGALLRSDIRASAMVPQEGSATDANNGAAAAAETAAAAARLEKDIVPVNLLPQPPRKSRSLVHLLSQRGSDDYEAGSDMYGMLMGGHHGGDGLAASAVYYDDIQYDRSIGGAVAASAIPQHQRHHQMLPDGGGDAMMTSSMLSMGGPDVVMNPSGNNTNMATNRELLNVIMDAREKDGSGGMDDLLLMHEESLPTMQADHQSQQPDAAKTVTPAGALPVAHKFSGVFFMAEMNTPQKYPKPDITAALEARRVTKNLDRMESYGSGGIDSMIDIVLTETAQKQQALKMQQQLQQQHHTGSATGGTSILLTGAKQSIQRFGNVVSAATASAKPNGSRASGLVTPGGSKLTDLASGLY